MNMFQAMYQDFKFDKDKITLFEAFAGVGSQAMALKKLAKEFDFELETIGISEIDKYAIASYNVIHGETKNFGSITDIQEIPKVDIFTYSFPCQDISLAGKGKGFSKDSGTRSGLLWEVERLLENQHKLGKLPKVLLMENVKALAGAKFIDDFTMWREKLKTLGYSNYWEILNAKDYGIPQNRERVFMVSVLGEYNYTFPKQFELKLRLKDMLEDEVDDKYYLSDNQLEKLLNDNQKNIDIENLHVFDYRYDEGLRTRVDDYLSPTLHTKIGGKGLSGNIFIPIPEDTKLRKLTPLETWRLMGFSDQDFTKAEKVCSNTQLYKQAGNSIVVDVLYYIFKKLFKGEI